MKKLVLSAIPVGLCFGLGMYVFHYGKGYSYFIDDPNTCINCHIMQPQYDQWMHSSHKIVASCNDCHVPHTFPNNWITKGINGFNHSWAFTSGNFHEPIRIKKRNAKILQQNCLSCHGEFVSNIHPQGLQEKNSISCVKCHKSVGHGGR